MEEEKILNTEELEKVAGGIGWSPEVIYARAVAEIGKPAGSGASAVGPFSYDTSGLVSYCVSGNHIRIGTTNTFMTWPRVSDPRPGDICTNYSYCGIYAGSGSMIYVSSAKGCVTTGHMASDMIIVRYGG